MYTILYWTFHVHGFVHDFMRVLWYCVILHDVTFALKALYFNGNDIVWHAMIKKLLVPRTVRTLKKAEFLEPRTVQTLKKADFLEPRTVQTLKKADFLEPRTV